MAPPAVPHCVGCAEAGDVVAAAPAAGRCSLLQECRLELEAIKAELAGLCHLHTTLRSRLLVRKRKPIRLLETPPHTGPPEPIVPQERWDELPEWIRLSFFRGHLLPALADDPLFWGRGDPCVLPFVPTKRPRGRGVAVFVPGGNYEFLTPQEGEPLAQWLAQDLNVPAFVLRYRLLPAYNFEDMAADLRVALRQARAWADGGPVAVFGFSAGAHLAACTSAGEPVGGAWRPDAQVFLYPVITTEDWFSVATSGFFRADVKSAEVRSLARSQERLLAGPAFVPPPPTFMVSSTGDNVCPPSRHSDLYAVGMESAGVAFEYMRGDYGDHGFPHLDFWRAPCLEWLRGQGFGPRPDV